MILRFQKRFLLRLAFFTATASVLLALAPLEAEAAKPPPTPLSCSISPADGLAAVGVPITFTGSTQGGKGGKSYSWDFSAAAGVPGTSTDTSVDVTYGTEGGPYAVLLDVTDKDGGTASCSTTVTVTDDGTPPPTATGEELFLKNCRMCHGIEAVGGFAQRDIRNSGSARIRGAITRRADMNFLGIRPNPLTDVEIDSIAAYLDTLTRGQDDIPKYADLVAGEDQFRKYCSYCHSLSGDLIEPPRPGPDLMTVGSTYSDAFIGAWIAFPTEMIEAGANRHSLEPYWMPDLGLSDLNAWDIAQFMIEQEAIGPLVDTPPVDLTPEQFEASTEDYFNYCAGCHGRLRGGATGPNIDSARSKDIGTDGLIAIMTYGTPAGMVNFGQSGLLSAEQITNLAAYLQLPPPDAPEMPMEEIIASWHEFIPVANRPAEPEHTRNWENYTGVVLRDASQVAIFDGDTNEEIVRLDTGFAVHILRSSSSGRYFYAIGRDGLVTMIDLWSDIPTIVANVRGCHDARSVDGSKFTGYEDAFIIEGCYWPPQYVVYDGLTLEPLSLVDLRTPAGPDGIMTDIYGVEIPENRIASIVASHNDPVWVVSLKESGHVGIVDYSDPEHPMTSKIATAKFLHDGGFDHSGNYFLVAANTSNKMVVVDLVNLELDALIDTGIKPHPGRGANWVDPDFGWVNATPHMSEGKITVYGADPVGRPDKAWQIVRTIPLPSAGSLFIKSYPNPQLAPYVLVDMTLSASHGKDICAIAKATGDLADDLDAAIDPDGDGCFTVATNGKAVHFEFNMGGTEVWISDWAADGAVIVLDSTTLIEKRRFTGLPTPTGKFNVYNTAHDIY